MALPAGAVHGTTVFELDGNIAAGNGSPAGADWASVYSPRAPGTVFVLQNTEGPTVDTTYFAGGGSKDDLPISSWRWGGSGAPDKNEITNAYAFANEDHTRGLWVYFGLDRFSTGESAVSFWFFRNPVGLASLSQFSGSHTVGDVLVQTIFTQGGTLGTIEVYEWVGTGGSHGPLNQRATGVDCTTVPAVHLVCGRINSAGVSPPWPYTPKSGASGTIPATAFVEIGMNLTGIFASSNAGGEVPCLTTFLAATRSSHTIDAALKDFAMGNFNTCAPTLNIAKTPSAANVPFGGSFTWNLAVSVTGRGTAQSVVVNDTIPSSLTIGSPLPAGCSAVGQEVTCNLGSMTEAGGTRNLAIPVRAASSTACGEITNRATVAGTGLDPVTSAPATVRITCATLTVAKTTSPSSTDPFSFVFADSASNTETRTVNAGSSYTWTLAPGTYSLQEQAATGYALTDLVCLSGSTPVGTINSPTATVTLADTNAVTCTFTNTKLAKIQVDKATLPPGHTQTFGFTVTGPGPATIATPSLADLSPVWESGWLAPGSGYSVSENTLPADWVLTSSSCDGTGNTPASITLVAGGIVKCTFTNTLDGKLTIAKTTVAPIGDTTTFGFTGDLTFAGNLANGGSQTFNVVPGTSYTVRETAMDGWALTGMSCTGRAGATSQVLDASVLTGVTANLDPGEQITCTFTNTKLAKIQVDKVTLPASHTQTFGFAVTGPGPTSLGTPSLADATAVWESAWLMPGSGYSVSENTPPTGWVLTSSSCDGTGNTPASITLPAGGVVKCTFTNTLDGRLTIAKATVAPDGDATTFAFTGGLTFAGELGDGNSETFWVTPGTGYTVLETAKDGWALTGMSCDGRAGATSQVLNAGVLTGVTANLDPGEQITCTFTNTKLAKIQVDKVTLPASHTQTFGFAVTGPGPTSLGTPSLADATAVWESAWLMPGSGYSVSENTPPTGWVLTSSSCDGTGNTPSAITLGPGDVVKCTFTNTLDGRLTIAKTTVAPTGDTTTFGFTGDLTFAGELGNGGSQTFWVTPGTGYSVAETATSGWLLSDVTCTGRAAATSAVYDLLTSDLVGVAATLNPGEEITCTFTNVKLAKILVVKQASGFTATESNPGPSFAFTASWVTGGFNLPTGGSYGSSLWLLPSNLLGAGESYAVSEAPSTDTAWALQSTTCQDADSNPRNPADITLNAGDVVTCTFVNQFSPNQDPDYTEYEGTIGFWRNWDAHKHFTEAEIAAMLATVDANSAWFGSPAIVVTTAHDLTALIDAATNDCSKSYSKNMCAKLRFEAQYIVLHLNVVSGKKQTTFTYDLSGFTNAAAYLGLSTTNPVSLADVFSAIESKYSTSPNRQQYIMMASVADWINNQGI